MQKLAIIGKGKTGGEVLKLLSADESPIVFDQSHPVSVDALKMADAAIIFVPGAVVPHIFETVLAAGIATVWGSTGFNWPENLHERLVKTGARWVFASNFSPMMLMIQKMLQVIKTTAPYLLTEPRCEIHEIHHIRKKDQPSGTALSWQEWVGLPCTISAEREGDVKGIHTLKLATAEETLTIRHEVHDRRVFAQGALWAARYLLKHPELAPGFYPFYNLFELLFQEKI